MPLLNHQQLRRSYDAALKDGQPQKFYRPLFEALEEGHIKPNEFSIAQLFEQFVPHGRELRQSFNPSNSVNGINLLEAGHAIDTSAFSNISGQIVYTRVLEAFNEPNLLWPELVETIPTQFDGEKIPGIGRLGDESEAIGEGQTYPTAGVSEEWVETPETIKRGFIVPVTKEAVFFDRTGLVLKRAGEVANRIALNKEKRVLDVALGLTTTYKRNGATAAATYGDTPFDNLAASNALVDWTDIEAAELLFDALTDPNTGEAINVIPDTIIVPTALKHTAYRIVNATQVRQGAISATVPVTLSASPIVAGQYRVLSSPLVKARTSSATTWFIGQPKRAFAYMENWGPQVMQANDNSEAEFTQDIVARYKVSERGAAAILEPRYMCKSTA